VKQAIRVSHAHSSGAPRQAFAAHLLLALLLPLFLAACSFPLCAQGKYRISGRVVNSVTGEPIRRATVSVLTEGDFHLVATVQSDADGNFSIDNLAAGKYPLSAAKRGFRTSFFDEHDDYNSAVVTGEGQDTTNLVFQLTPGAVLHGVVTDDAGDPVENASVLLAQQSDFGPTPGRPTRAQNTNTDDRGEYEFSDLKPGEYLIAVKGDPWYAQHTAARGPNGETSPLDVTLPVTYFDSTTDEASASPITLAAGEHQEANISLHAVPALRLRLTTVRRQQNPAPMSIRQTAFGIDVPAAGDFQGSGQGSVDIVGLAPGHYELTQGDPPRLVELDATASSDIDPNAGTPFQPVSGTLRMAEGTPLPDDLNLFLQPVDHGQPVSTSAHKGQFHFDAVPPGVWEIHAQFLQSQWWVVSVGATAGSELTVRDKPLSIDLTVSRTETRVEGFARHGDKPAPGVMILLVPRAPSAYRALVRRDQSDTDGSFSLRGVPAGQYTVIAIEEGWKLDWQRRENIERYLPGGQTVTISSQASSQTTSQSTSQSGAVISLPHPVQAVPR
jgi:hypothetical protein